MRSRTHAAVGIPALLALAACRGAPAGPADLPAFDPVAESASGMVVSGSPYATEAGVRMLERGGNAVDAAVAAAFALAVAEPTQSGLGGRTQLLFRRADGLIHGIDGGTEVPAGYDPEEAPAGETGRAAVGIPGTVAALTRLLAEHGSLPLAEVLTPAVGWAEGGVVLPEGEADRIRRLAAEEGPGSDVVEVFSLASADVPSAADGPERSGTSEDPGATDPAGTRASLTQPALARTLRAVADEGRAGFYEGRVAERIARYLTSGGGFVSATDLAGYRALDSPVGRVRVADLVIVGSYLPASGVTVAQILAILDRARLPPDEAGWAEAVATALVMGFEDRETAEAMEPAEAVAWLTSDSLIGRRAGEISKADVADAVYARAGDPVHATDGLGAGDGVEPPFTTHVSVADRQGNVVALTQSLGPSGGARVVTPDLGFLYASTLGGYLTAGDPGDRPWSSQAPILVLRQGKPVFVMGGAGARRIISALVTTLSRIVHRGATLRQAMDAPRLHPTEGRILVEDGWDVASVLTQRGYEVEHRDRSYFARLNVIGLDGETMTGIAQPEWSGASAGAPGND